jgi:hypothetical protein
VDQLHLLYNVAPVSYHYIVWLGKSGNPHNESLLEKAHTPAKFTPFKRFFDNHSTM